MKASVFWPDPNNKTQRTALEYIIAELFHRSVEIYGEVELNALSLCFTSELQLSVDLFLRIGNKLHPTSLVISMMGLSRHYDV